MDYQPSWICPREIKGANFFGGRLYKWQYISGNSAISIILYPNNPRFGTVFNVGLLEGEEYAGYVFMGLSSLETMMQEAGIELPYSIRDAWKVFSGEYVGFEGIAHDVICMDEPADLRIGRVFRDRSEMPNDLTNDLTYKQES